MSYSSDIKHELVEISIKTTCCRKAFLYGLLYTAVLPDEPGETVTVRCPLPAGWGTDNVDYLSLIAGLCRAQLGVQALLSPETRGAHRYLRITVQNKQLLRNLRTMSAATEAGEDIIPRMLGFRCNDCHAHFLRGLFLCTGTVNDPSKSYHMELRAPSDGRADLLLAYILAHGFTPGCTRRRGDVGYIWKNSSAIQDFLTYLGATGGVFDMLNTQIERDIRNNENRATNCVAENISRSMGAGARQLLAIRYLCDNDLIPALTPELQYTAQLRLDHPEATLAELAALHEPAITKSGLNHRMDKILAYVEKVKRDKEK